jgi:type I restriction enzyme M protein
MLDSVTKKRIDTLRQILVGKLPDPKAQIEQITNGLIYKFMNDMDEESVFMGGKSTYFSGKYQKYSWKNLLDTKTSGIEKLSLYSEAIEQMYYNENLPELFREIFKNSFLPFKDPSTLNMFLKEINEFHYSNSEKLGDAFEYLLSFMGSQGDAGQFRTPRHIIDFIVEIVNPQKNETILDPACGTAGFLISSYKHILKQNTKKNLGDGLTASDRKKIGENLNGYDISPDMVKMSLVNMYLHKFTNPKINEYDTLSSESRWNEYYDVILANPPFFSPKGGIVPHNRFGVKSKKAELLFVDYINEHLKPNGRAGIIVPEGIIFQKNNAYKKVRKTLIDKSLIAVISFPQGIFNPYSGVKTSLLILDKDKSKKLKNIFIGVADSDGFTLTTSRKKSDENDLGKVFFQFKNFYKEEKITENDKFFLINKNNILKNNIISLSSNEYLKNKTTKSGNHVLLEKLIEESKLRYNGEKRNILSISNTTGFVDPNQIFSHKIASDDIKNYKKVDKNYFAYNPSRINIGSIAFNQSNEVGFVSPMYVVFKNLNTKKLNNKFLFNLLKSKLGIQKIKEKSFGTIRISLKFENLINISIPLPPIEIQNQVVEELDGYQKIIDGCKQVINNYKPDIFFKEGWQKKKIKDLSKLTYGLGKTAQTNGKYRYVRITDINDKGLLMEDDKKYLEIKGNEKKYILQKGDVLIARTGATYGKCLFFESNEPSVFAGYLIKLEFDKKVILPKFFWIFSQSLNFDFQKKRLVVGSGQPQFNANTLGEVEVPIPSLKEQKEIIDHILEEQNIIYSNLNLVKKFEKKINDKIDTIWSN